MVSFTPCLSFGPRDMPSEGLLVGAAPVRHHRDMHARADRHLGYDAYNLTACKAERPWRQCPAHTASWHGARRQGVRGSRKSKPAPRGLPGRGPGSPGHIW